MCDSINNTVCNAEHCFTYYCSVLSVVSVKAKVSTAARYMKIVDLGWFRDAV